MPVDYERFLAQLRRNEAADLTAQLKTFLARFAETPSVLQTQRRMTAAFLEHIYSQSVDHEVFRGPTEQDLPDVENIREGWEKVVFNCWPVDRHLVMSKIHGRVFGAPGTDEAKSNAVLYRKMESFLWVEERHLDIPFSFHLTLEVAQAELLRINGFKAPRDKFVILQNTVQIVADLVKRHMGNGETDAAGNDSLLPTLILVVLRANPSNMISNIKYIMRFRNSHELEQGQNQFCLTNVMGAISFIYNMTPASLTLTDNERRKMGIAINLSSAASSSSPASASVSITKLSPGSLPPLSPTGTDSSPSGQHQQPHLQYQQRTGGRELNRIAGQVSQFFGNIIKEVRVMGSQAADEIAGIVAPSPTTPDSSANASPVPASVGTSAATTPTSFSSATTQRNRGTGTNGLKSVSFAPVATVHRMQAGYSEASSPGSDSSASPGTTTHRPTASERAREIVDGNNSGASASSGAGRERRTMSDSNTDDEEFELQLALALSLSEASAAAEAEAEAAETAAAMAMSGMVVSDGDDGINDNSDATTGLESDVALPDATLSVTGDTDASTHIHSHDGTVEDKIADDAGEHIAPVSTEIADSVPSSSKDL